MLPTVGGLPRGSASVPPPATRPTADNGQPSPSKAPLVVVLSAPQSLVNICQEAIALLGGRVEPCSMSEASALAVRERPTLIVVPEEIYPFDRRAFNLLALQLNAPLIVWGSDMDPADLQALIFASRRS